MNWAQFKDPVSHMCHAGAVVTSWSLIEEVTGSSPFNEKYFVTEIVELRQQNYLWNVGRIVD